MIIEAGLEEADCIVCGVETLESVDAGDAEFDLDPNCAVPVVVELKALVVELVVTVGDVGVVLVVDNDDSLNCGNVGDTGRATLEVDIDDTDAVVKGVGPGFSCEVSSVEWAAGVDNGVESALRIGMSLIFGDEEGVKDVEDWLFVMLLEPRFTCNKNKVI